MVRPQFQRSDHGVPRRQQFSRAEQFPRLAQVTQLAAHGECNRLRLARCGRHHRCRLVSVEQNQSSGGNLRRAFPSPFATHMFARHAALCARFLAMRRKPLHPPDQRSVIRLQHPAGLHQLHAADAAAESFSDRWQPVSEFVRSEIIRGAARCHDDRQSTRHRFQHRQAEAFAAIRMHEAIARRVQSGQRFGRKLVVQIKDLRRTRLRLRGLHLRLERLAGINALPAKIFDHETDIILRGEAFEIRLEQHVRAFAQNSSADEEELERLLRRQLHRLRVGLKYFRVDPVRHDVNLLRLDARVHVNAAHVIARHPDFIHAGEVLDPFLRQRSKLPRLNENPRAIHRRIPARRPGVADGDLRGLRRLRTQLARAIQDGLHARQRLGHGVLAEARQLNLGAAAQRARQFAVHMRQAAEIQERSVPANSH